MISREREVHGREFRLRILSDDVRSVLSDPPERLRPETIYLQYCIPNFFGAALLAFLEMVGLVPTAPSARDCCYGQASALATYGSFKTPHHICTVEIMP